MEMKVEASEHPGSEKRANCKAKSKVGVCYA